MRKRSIIFIAVLVVIFSILTMTLVSCKKPVEPVEVNVNDLEVYMGAGWNGPYNVGNYYVGTKTFTGNGIETNSKLNLTELFGADNTYAIEKNDGGREASLSGTELTIYGATGKKDGDWFDIHIMKDGVDTWMTMRIVNGGYNVFTYEQFLYTVQQANMPTVVHKNLNFVLPRDVTPIAETSGVYYDKTIVVKSDIYGNGKVFNAEGIASKKIIESKNGDYAPDVLYCDEAVGNIKLQDFKIYGKKLQDGAVLDLNDLSLYGCLIRNTPAKNNHNNITLRNLIVENSHKNVYFSNCDALVDGCIIRNAADSTVSIETTAKGGVNVTLKNTVIANSVTAGVVMWGYSELPKEAFKNKDQNAFVNLKVEGFLDIYNWKDETTTNLMPQSEGAADMVNGMVADQLGKPQFEPYFHKDENNVRSIHLGMIILATGGLKQNRAQINGVIGADMGKDETSRDVPNTEFEIKKFPLPEAASLIAKTCLLVGYNKDEFPSHITPSSTLDSNPNMYLDCYFGRGDKAHTDANHIW